MDEEDEEVLMQRALELSMLDAGMSSSSTSAAATTTAPTNPTPAAAAGTSAATGSTFLDPDFVNALLQSSDLDMNDPLIQAALAQLGNSSSSDGSGGGGTNNNNDDANKKRKGDEAE